MVLDIFKLLVCYYPIEKHRCDQSVEKVFREGPTLNISMIACVFKCTICSFSRLQAASSTFIHLWLEGNSRPRYLKLSIHSSGSLLYIMHDLSLFWLFTCIIFVLELLTLNLVCMQKNSNAFISFCASPEVFAKNTTSSSYSKSIMTTFLMATSDGKEIRFASTRPQLSRPIRTKKQEWKNKERIHKMLTWKTQMWEKPWQPTDYRISLWEKIQRWGSTEATTSCPFSSPHGGYNEATTSLSLTLTLYRITLSIHTAIQSSTTNNVEPHQINFP